MSSQCNVARPHIEQNISSNYRQMWRPHQQIRWLVECIVRMIIDSNDRGKNYIHWRGRDTLYCLDSSLSRLFQSRVHYFKGRWIGKRWSSSQIPFSLSQDSSRERNLVSLIINKLNARKITITIGLLFIYRSLQIHINLFLIFIARSILHIILLIV